MVPFWAAPPSLWRHVYSAGLYSAVNMQGLCAGVVQVCSLDNRGFRAFKY